MAETWLVDTRTLGTRPTGIGLYAYRHLKRMMANAERAGEGVRKFVLVCDVATSDEAADLQRRGCAVVAYGKRICNSIGLLGYFRFVRRVIREVRPDVFWQPNNLQPFRPAAVKRVIVTMHDVFGLGKISLPYFAWHLYYRLAFGRTLRNATEIWYNSKETKREVEALSARARRLEGSVVYPITEVLPPERTAVEACRMRYGKFFLFVGNLETRKGADLLLAAYRRYRARGGTASLVLAGAERDVHPVPGDGIVVLGYVDVATKFALMAASLALVVPSRAEGYGMQVAEAAAMGIRCLASDLSVFREIDPAGRLTYPAGDIDALVRLLEEAST